jgi:hypothetical protein
MFHNLSRSQWLVLGAAFAIVLGSTGFATASARERARDFKRLADTVRIQSALELFFNATNSYPKTDQEIALGGSGARCLGAEGFQPACPSAGAVFLASVPAQTTIGLGASFAHYGYTSNGTSYALRLSVEQGWPELGIGKEGVVCLRPGKSATMLGGNAACTP